MCSSPIVVLACYGRNAPTEHELARDPFELSSVRRLTRNPMKVWRLECAERTLVRNCWMTRAAICCGLFASLVADVAKEFWVGVPI